MFFQQLELGPGQNFSYLIGCEKTKECGVIDVGYEHEKILETTEENGYKITKIFISHFHYDHSQEAEILAEKTGSQIFGHESALMRKSEGIFVVPKNILPLKDEEKLEIGETEGTAFFVPGHEPSHMLYLFENCLFTGDVLFIGKTGRTDLPFSDPEEMQRTLERIRNFPDEWIVYPGHNYGEVPFRSLGEEKKLNPYLKGEMLR